MTEAHITAAKENGKKGGHAGGMSEEHRAKLREAQVARREREKAERLALGITPEASTEKRKPGRPKKESVEASIETPKRPVGRPKKTETGETEETENE